jgi:hypothetical protein
VQATGGGATGAERAIRPVSATADPLRARRFFFGGLAVGVLVMSAVGLATAMLAESPRDVAARSAAPVASVLTATARWHVLTDIITVTGIVTAARTIGVPATAPFRVVTVTKMPVRPGDRVWPGHVIAEIDGRPMLLLQGRLPAYRDLHEGDVGPDVAQLQEALERAGYAEFEPAHVVGPSTALALLLLYRPPGYQAPLYHRITGSARSAPTPESYSRRWVRTFVHGRSGLVVSVQAQVGTVVRGGLILSLATGRPFVASALSAYQAALARRGMAVRIRSASPALKATGRLARIGRLPSPGGSSTGGPGTGGSATTRYPIEVSCGRPLPQRLIGTTVRLTLAAPLTAGPVLLVPVAAIVGPPRRRGGYVVEITSSGAAHEVAVFTGPMARGLVAVQSVRAGAPAGRPRRDRDRSLPVTSGGLLGSAPTGQHGEGIRGVAPPSQHGGGIRATGSSEPPGSGVSAGSRAPGEQSVPPDQHGGPGEPTGPAPRVIDLRDVGLRGVSPPHAGPSRRGGSGRQRRAVPGPHPAGRRP